MPNPSAFPEELLETVLSYCIVASLSKWHRLTLHLASSQIRSRLAILLVSKRFYRIGIPLFYHTIHVLSPKQLHLLLTDALRPNSSLATYVRRIVMPGIWAEAGELLWRCCNSLRFLDITIDSAVNSQDGRDADAEEFCKSLYDLRSLTHIVVRKPYNVYLTRSRPQYVLAEMAKAMQGWNDLEHIDLAFRLSDDSGAPMALLTVLPGVTLPGSSYRPQPTRPPGPVTQLTQALSTRPRLRTFSTSLPNVWNENILRVSQNPALERIILTDGTANPKGVPSANVMGTGHFLVQAIKHPRLSELIGAGTSIVRCRTQSLGTTCPTPSVSNYCGTDSPYSAPPQASHGHDACPSPARISWPSTRSWEHYPSTASRTPGPIGNSSQKPRLSASVP